MIDEIIHVIMMCFTYDGLLLFGWFFGAIVPWALGVSVILLIVWDTYWNWVFDAIRKGENK
jgi:hypothetical protein